jgi:FAD/FMN-containing dehydrogenase
MSTHAIFRPEDTRFRVDAQLLSRRLREVLPRDGLVEDEAGRRTYECDGLAAYRQLPLLVALPETVEQAQAVLRICTELEVPVVARGSGTSLSGGWLPHPQGVLLSLGKFNRILEIDPERRIAFQAPCTLQHGQKLPNRVEALLARIGFTLIPVPDAHLCCGSAGTYSVLQPTLSKLLRANKLTALGSGQPELIATANIGCLSHLAVAAELPVRHWLELAAVKA